MRGPLIILAFSVSTAVAAQPTQPYPPVIALPAEYPHARPSVGTSQPSQQWWKAFGDPALDRLIATAIDGNLDIVMAAARLEQAAAIARGARAAQAPDFGASASAAVQRLSLEDPAIAPIARSPAFERTVERYGLGLGVSWELDLFGRLSAGRRAAEADRAAAQADLAGARLSVIAEMANTYVTVREVERRLAVARTQVETLAALDRLVALRVERGIVPALDRDRSVAEYAAAQSAVPVLQSALVELYNRIDVLAGRPIGNAALELGSGQIPSAAESMSVDPPASLVSQRPDLVAAELRVAAADARVGQAIASRKPSLNLSGLVSLLTGGLSTLFSSDANQAGGSAIISAPIFDAGRGRSRVDDAEGGRDAAVAVYRLAVLRAASEVDDSLAALSRRREQAQALTTSEAALEAARLRASLSYRAGMANLTDVLDAERQLQTVQNELASARAESARAAVAVWRAIGAI